MKPLEILAGILVLMVSPMWYFLLWSILDMLQPDRLVWFIFWAYVPMGMAMHIVGQILKAKKVV
jgi:hypothetical protein